MDRPDASSHSRAAGRAALWVSLRERLVMVAIAAVLICAMAAWLDPRPRFMVAMLVTAVVLLAAIGLVALAVRRFLIGRRR